jgi:hypothetical protein
MYDFCRLALPGCTPHSSVVCLAAGLPTAFAVLFDEAPFLANVGEELTKQAVVLQIQCEHVMDLVIRRMDGMSTVKEAERRRPHPSATSVVNGTLTLRCHNGRVRVSHYRRSTMSKYLCNVRSRLGMRVPCFFMHARTRERSDHKWRVSKVTASSSAIFWSCSGRSRAAADSSISTKRLVNRAAGAPSTRS